MRDWRRLVSEKIDRVHLPTAQKEEIAAELGSHLEEVYEEQRRLGLLESEAFEGALSEVFDWAELTRRIHNAKREERIMNDRTKQLWLPGLASFWTAWICELALGGGYLSGQSFFHSHKTQVVYAVWLLTQFGCGALGAYLSRRAGGPRPTRFAAALFTSCILLVTMVIVISICAAARQFGIAFGGLGMPLLMKAVLVVILIPGIAMFTGALPFLSDSKHTPIAQ